MAIAPASAPVSPGRLAEARRLIREWNLMEAEIVRLYRLSGDLADNVSALEVEAEADELQHRQSPVTDRIWALILECTGRTEADLDDDKSGPAIVVDGWLLLIGDGNRLELIPPGNVRVLG